MVRGLSDRRSPHAPRSLPHRGNPRPEYGPGSREVKSLARLLGILAAEAATAEILVSPKPGLVDPQDRGNHRDMDWTVPLSQLRRPWPPTGNTRPEGAWWGFPPPQPCPPLQARGRTMESDMFAATGGINTHKGLIFALSLWLYAAGRTLFLRIPPSPEALGTLAGAPRRGAWTRISVPSGRPSAPPPHPRGAPVPGTGGHGHPG